LTAAFVVWQIGLAFPDENNCSPVGCEPFGLVSFLVAVIIIIGVWLSSKAGWEELSYSEISRKTKSTTAFDFSSEGQSRFKKAAKAAISDFKTNRK
jgi:hypothetical protein